MVRVVLTEEQIRALSDAQESVQLCDAKGNVLRIIGPEWNKETLIELKRRASKGPWYSGKQVQARLQALQEEWDRTGGFDETYMKKFLDQLNAADPGRMPSQDQKG